jgi:hypothetical protein
MVAASAATREVKSEARVTAPLELIFVNHLRM